MKGTKISRLMPFGKFKGMEIDEMEKDYMKKFVNTNVLLRIKVSWIEFGKVNFHI